MQVTFKNKYNFEGKEFESINLDLDGLKGSDIIDAQRQFTQSGNFSAVISTDTNFQLIIASKAAAQPLEFFNELPAPEFMKVTQAVQNFLLGSI